MASEIIPQLKKASFKLINEILLALNNKLRVGGIFCDEAVNFTKLRVGGIFCDEAVNFT